ncbi:MAG: nicotinamide mononucleotide transporter [Bacteroidia bacterium]|nr:nicotinamide mononucleotide transporter [Bacteroidia bacterium]
MSLLSIIALIFGVLGVWLTIKETIWCWPAALIAVVASIAEFYSERLYGDMSLQVFYFFAGIYGWYFWKRKSANSNIVSASDSIIDFDKETGFRVKNLDKKQLPALIIATAIQAVVYYYLLVYFGGDKPVLDSILTACSLTVTYMMTKKWVENWFAWVVIDMTYVLLYLIKDMWLFAILNFFMAGVAFYGWLKWRKIASLK